MKLKSCAKTRGKQAGAELCQAQSSADLRSQLISEITMAQSTAKLIARSVKVTASHPLANLVKTNFGKKSFGKNYFWPRKIICKVLVKIFSQKIEKSKKLLVKIFGPKFFFGKTFFFNKIFGKKIVKKIQVGLILGGK